MSATALKWARTQMPRKANGARDSNAKHVLLTLADMHNDKDVKWRVFPGQRLISQRTGLAMSTVSKCLQVLEMQGYLRRDRRHRQGGERQGQRTSDLYTLNLERPADDLTTREAQPMSLRRTQGGSPGASGAARRSPASPNPDRGVFFETFGAPRHRANRSSWSTNDLVDEVNDRFVWAFGWSPLRIAPWLAALGIIHQRLGQSVLVDVTAISAAFDDDDELMAMGHDLPRAPQRLIFLIAAAYIDGRTSQRPEIKAALIMRTGDGSVLATDGTSFSDDPTGRSRRDQHDLNLERQRLGIAL